MKFAWFWGETSQVMISTASCSDPTCLLKQNSLLRCVSVSDKRVTGERSLVIVGISKKGVYVVMAVMVAAVMVAAVLVVAVVAAVVGESRLVAAVEVGRDGLKSMPSLSAIAMSLIDVNIMLVGHWSLDMVEMVIFGTIVSVQREMNGTVWWLSFLRNVGVGRLFIFLEGCFVPDPSISSLFVVPDFPSMLFSYLFTTSSPLPLLLLCLYLVVWHILLIVPVLSGVFSVHSCNSHHLTCLEVTRGLGDNGRSFLCNVGATQPIGIFLPPPSCKSTQLSGFDILPPSRNSTQSCGFGIINSFHYGPCNGSPPFPPSSPSLSFPSLFGRVVCWLQMCSVPLIYKLLTPHRILHPYPRLFLPVFPLNSTHPCSFYTFLACYCLHLEFLEFLRFFLLSGASSTNFSSTMYAFIASEEHLELTTIYPACKFRSI